MERQPPVYVISGTPAAGKSTVASELARRFRFGLHIPLDDLREWVVAGRSNPVPVWTEETTRQFRLARQAAVAVTRIYSSAGFAVVIDDVVLPLEAGDAYGDLLSGMSVYFVLLRPSLEETLDRNRRRENKPFDTAALEPAIRDLHLHMGLPGEGVVPWIVFDNGGLSVEETVDLILVETGLTESD